MLLSYSITIIYNHIINYRNFRNYLGFFSIISPFNLKKIDIIEIVNPQSEFTL